jgi:NADH-quinone oxidoreductase subunit H
VLLLVAGCERRLAPPLVEVAELTPREIEPGDRLEVRGTGFPQGRTGRVTLEGTVFRPGEPPMRGVSIDAEGTVATPDRLEIVVREALAERFCGRGDRATHATFRGDVEVAFASNNPGAPPLVGVLHGAVLDVMPSSARASLLEAGVAEGGRVLAFLGVVPGTPSPRGVPIEQVRAGSLASQSGIQVGDVLVSVDGVDVLSLGDVVPASARAVDVTIRHADSGAEETKTLSLIDYSGERVPSEYAPALIVVGLALAVLLLLVLPGPPSLVSLELRIASRVRRTTLRELVGALVGDGRHAALSAIVSAVIAAFSLTPYVVGREVDGVVMLAAASIMLVWSRVVGERGALASLKTLLRMGLALVAMAGAIALAIGQVGAIELAEIVRLQGGAPWQFAAARYPSCAILGVVYVVAALGILRTRLRDASKSGAVSPDAPPAHAALLERAGLLLAAALGVTTFLGGWQLPGVTALRGNGLFLAAAAVFVAKTWLLAALLLGASRVTTSLRPRDVQALVLKKLVPGLVVAAAVVAASRRLVPSIAVETAFGATLVALTVLFSVRMAARVRAAVGRPEPHASPFL